MKKIVSVNESQFVSLVEKVVSRLDEAKNKVNEGTIDPTDKEAVFSNVVKLMEGLTLEIKKAKTGSYDKSVISENLNKLQELLINTK